MTAPVEFLLSPCAYPPYNGGIILAKGIEAPTYLREFVEHVVPELQRRGLTKTNYEGKTLRETSTSAVRELRYHHAARRLTANGMSPSLLPASSGATRCRRTPA